MHPLIKDSLVLGGKQGLKSGFSLLCIMVPISFVVALLNWTGLLGIISNAISPVFKYFGLPGSAALSFVTGTLLNCYSAIAIMITLPLDHREITILALMILFSHNLPLEASVQKKTGSSALFICLYRLGAGIAGGFCLNLIMPGTAVSMGHAAPPASTAAFAVPFLGMMLTWLHESFSLIVKVMLIIIGLMIFNRFLKDSGAAYHLSRFLSPLLRLFGLSQEAGFLFIIANTLGLAYGGGVMLAEREECRISGQGIRELNVFIATCHSLLEDTLLFVAIGASALWIIVPRLIVGGGGVWVYRAMVTGKSKNTSSA
jgi:spore maturation protein SpmB